MRDLPPPQEFKPIDDAARDGNPRIVKLGSNFARAKWTGAAPDDPAGMWAFDFGAGSEAVHQIDFEPNEYAELRI